MAIFHCYVSSPEGKHRFEWGVAATCWMRFSKLRVLQIWKTICSDVQFFPAVFGFWKLSFSKHAKDGADLGISTHHPFC